jgi:hypothetical protein
MPAAIMKRGRRVALSVVFLITFLLGIVAHAAEVVEEKTCSADGECDADNTDANNKSEDESTDEIVHEYTHKFNFECTDKHESCPSWAEAGDCQGEPAGYVNVYCPKSCNTCDDLADKAASNISIQDMCKDDHYQCSEWAGMGECDAVSYVYCPLCESNLGFFF